MTRVTYLYLSTKYALAAWLDRMTGWRWVNDMAWDAAFAKNADALDELAAEAEQEIALRAAPGFERGARADGAPSPETE